MSTAEVTSLNSTVLYSKVKAYRTLNNHTNWFYLAREYLYLATILTLIIGFYPLRADWGLAWAWNVPATLAAIVLMGIGQHRLAMLGHEASHYLLFRHRLLNELAANWFCFYPLWTIAHLYRLQHLAHHQFPNDPERDPDFQYMNVGGHRYRPPMTTGRFFWQCVVKPFLWVPGLIHYILIRAAAAAVGGTAGPYQPKERPPRVALRLELLYVVLLIASLFTVRFWGNPWLLTLGPAGCLLVVSVYAALAPERFYVRTTVKPDGPMRLWNYLRLVHLTLLFTALAWLTYLTDWRWGLYYLLLWLVPLGTTFSFFMMLREEIQHSNAGRERLRHTRVFEGNLLVRFAVFPLGMGYHLPHHLFPFVPHYHLHDLHRLLMQTEEYKRDVTVVEGYLLPHSA